MSESFGERLLAQREVHWLTLRLAMNFSRRILPPCELPSYFSYSNSSVAQILTLPLHALRFPIFSRFPKLACLFLSDFLDEKTWFAYFDVEQLSVHGWSAVLRNSSAGFWRMEPENRIRTAQGRRNLRMSGQFCFRLCYPPFFRADPYRIHISIWEIY